MTCGGSARRASASAGVGGAACGGRRGHVGHGAGRGVVATACHERLWGWRWRHRGMIASPAIIGSPLLLTIARAIGIIHLALFTAATIGEGADLEMAEMIITLKFLWSR